MKYLFTPLFTLLTITALSFNASALTKGGVSFKDVIKYKKQKLKLNGVGIREATIFGVDVYVAGIYLPKKTSNPQKLVKMKGNKILKMKFVRDVEKNKINEAWDKSLAKKKASKSYTKSLKKLKAAMPNIKEGDRFVFKFLKDKTVLSMMSKSKKKRTVVLKDKRFARSLLKVWFGANPPNESLKKGLLGI